MAENKENKNLTEKDVARLIITSKERAEDFIQKWMKSHHASREQAIKKLKELGVNISNLA